MYVTSSVEQVKKLLFLAFHILHVCGVCFWIVKKTYTNKIKLILIAPDDDTLVLWSEIIGLCKKLNIIYNIITFNP